MSAEAINESKRLQKRLERVIEIYKKRKIGCIDMLDFFCDHMNEKFETMIS